MKVARSLLACFAALFIAAGSAAAQAATVQPQTAGDGVPRVFLDCQANGCDDDFLRTELTWLNFVRDRTLALVHILVTSQQTASGGTELTATFIGLDTLSGKADTIVQFSPQADTHDERRKTLRRMIGQGMVRFVANTPLAARLNLSYDAPPQTGVVASSTRGAADKWNLWVFRVGGGTFFNGEESYKYHNVNGSFEARRTTAGSKIFLGVRGNRNEESYTLPDGEELVTKRRNYNMEASYIWTLNGHWSAGFQANASSSVTSNLELGTRIGPAIEYDVFPYSESTRRQLILRYGVGMKNLDYDSMTVYDRLTERLPDHRFTVAAEATQPWGGIFGNVIASQYLNDMSKYRIDGFVGMNWRIVRGLNLNFDIGYTKLRDQINLKRGTATEEEVLLRLRQLSTGYYYFGSISLSYTFGSVFSNVVNPRFAQGIGSFFF
jgi:hypothetical protein